MHNHRSSPSRSFASIDAIPPGIVSSLFFGVRTACADPSSESPFAFDSSPRSSFVPPVCVSTSAFKLRDLFRPVVLRFVFFFGVVASHSVSSSSSVFGLRLFLFGVRLGVIALSRVALPCSQSAHAPLSKVLYFTHPSPIGVHHISCLKRLLHLILALFIETGKALQLLRVTIAMECSCDIFGLRTAPELVSGRIHTIHGMLCTYQCLYFQEQWPS